MIMADSRVVSPELLATMVDLLPTVGSLRDLCAITGLRLGTVRRELAPFLAIMKLQGAHPQCGCGKDRFHPYGCVDSVAKAGPPKVAASILERRGSVISMLLAGDRFVDIDNALGLYPKSARKYLRFLTPEQLAERDRKVVERQSNPSETSK